MSFRGAYNRERHFRWYAGGGHPENFEVFERYLPPESTFGNRGQLFQHDIGNLKICISNIPFLFSSAPWLLALLVAQPPENFEVFAHYLQLESTFGNKGQLFYHAIIAIIPKNIHF